MGGEASLASNPLGSPLWSLQRPHQVARHMPATGPHLLRRLLEGPPRCFARLRTPQRLDLPAAAAPASASGCFRASWRMLAGVGSPWLSCLAAVERASKMARR